MNRHWKIIIPTLFCKPCLNWMTEHDKVRLTSSIKLNQLSHGNTYLIKSHKEERWGVRIKRLRGREKWPGKRVREFSGKKYHLKHHCLNGRYFADSWHQVWGSSGKRERRKRWIWEQVSRGKWAESLFSLFYHLERKHGRIKGEGEEKVPVKGGKGGGKKG